LFILLDRRFVLWQSILTPMLVLVSSITAVVACRLPSHARWLRYLLVGGYMTTALLITLFALVALGLPLAMQKA
jgi:hypothetical protein